MNWIRELFGGRPPRGREPISVEKLAEYVTQIGEAPHVLWRERERNEVFVSSPGRTSGVTFNLDTDSRDLASVLAYYLNRADGFREHRGPPLAKPTPHPPPPPEPGK